MVNQLKKKKKGKRAEIVNEDVAMNPRLCIRPMVVSCYITEADYGYPTRQNKPKPALQNSMLFVTHKYKINCVSRPHLFVVTCNFSPYP